MHSIKMSLMSLALLIIILSVQIQVHASPISAVQVRHGDRGTSAIFKRARPTATTTVEKQKLGTVIAGSPPKECSNMCLEEYKPYCATNSKGLKKKFGNKCKLRTWNCHNPNDIYRNETEGECTAK
ncbi:hypothetical protein BG015_002770 [Linnemannia schmuckeri]|uniref:Kazal-like domain-containing protein n=1 Tax=Linnemannia schmuckeri TaxID=64567 RepID=A0A9P5RNM9_9FUNG|nr:hypothetical protein BG015_002770 [Linnemannia schmuckeri]